MKTLLLNSARKKITGGLLFCIVLSVLTVGCDQKTLTEGVKLAQAGDATFEKLSNYYESLLGTNKLGRKHSALLFGLRGITISDTIGDPPAPTQAASSLRTSLEKFDKRDEVLRTRLKLVREVQSTYKALMKLAGKDASGEVSAAVDELNQAITTVKGSPFPPIVLNGTTVVSNPANLISNISGEIVKTIQARKVKRRVQELEQVIDDVRKLFKAETPFYEHLGHVRDDSDKALIVELMKVDSSTGNLINPIGGHTIFQPVLDNFGLKFSDDDYNPLGIPQFRTAALGLIEANGKERNDSITRASSSLDQSLENLKEAHMDFFVVKKVNLEKMIEVLNKVARHLEKMNS